MLFFLIYCFCFLLLSQSFLNASKQSKIQSRMWALPYLFQISLYRFPVPFRKTGGAFRTIYQITRNFESVKTNSSMKTNDVVVVKHEISLLDLPHLPLDKIIEKLSPSDLCNMAGVCSYLREKCKSDHFWKKHMERKWTKVIGEAAYREWQCQISVKRVPKLLNHRRTTSEKINIFLGFLNFFLHKSEVKKREGCLRNSLAVNSFMSFYLALETGKFWFPAQVMNRENGHFGFMFSCYDASLSYDSTTDNFVARFTAQGRRSIEADVDWSRIRVPNVDAASDSLHNSDCLHELMPEDHIEIQWRKSKEFPYGWWYGVVGHVESCIGLDSNCKCHFNDIVVIEFKQYSLGSRWRKISVGRKYHVEIANEGDGFYGGIRKLYKEEDIAKWKDCGRTADD